MDRVATAASRERDYEVDLESGCTVSPDDSSEETMSGVKKQAKNMLAKVCNRFIEGSIIKTEDKASLCGNVSVTNGVSVVENLKEEENKDDEGKKLVKEKRKKSTHKKSPKPPKPPRGPSLDAADMKLIREISELAMMKRARIERMKALKKMRAAKQSSSSSSNVIAMLFTVLFCVVLILQGMSSSKSTPVNIHGSRQPVRATEGGLISVQFSGNPSASYPNGPGSGSPYLMEQVAGSAPHEKPYRVAG